MDASEPTQGTAGLARTAETLWLPSPMRRRGPKPKLSRERIIETAVGLADAEGLAALSMQRISEELGCAKMALYRHVPGRAELTALMLDTIVGPPPRGRAPANDWRRQLRDWATSLFTIFNRHPWTLAASMGVRVMGPNELAWLETGVSSMAETCLTGAERLDTVVLITGHVRSLAQQRSTPLAAGTTLERALATEMSKIFAEHGDDYPQIREAFSSAARDSEQDNALDFGLDRILDGLAALIDSRSCEA